jgi:hypothetical protein
MRTGFWALLLSLAIALPVSAQETRGNISGTVKDSTGVIPGATVKIISTDTGATQELTTNDSGYFEAPLLQPGTYSVSVEMAGFKRSVQNNVVLAVGQQMSIPILLEVGQISEEVTVTAEAPLLDTSSVSSAQTFDSRMVESLPMFSNMPIMLTRFAAGVNPSTNQSLVSQGFADGTTSAAGAAFGGVGSNNYSIDGATNNGSGRRIAASPNADMIQEMRVESSNFDASVGHGLGLQISMMTRGGANQYRGTANYQYWTNKLNELNPSQRLTFTPAGKEAYEKGRSHNTSYTLGGPIIRNKMFFFGNYSYVNDFIPGKNQASSTVPANEAHLRGDFSDLLRLPNPAQYQIYDPLTVRRDPSNPNRFIRDPFPNNIIPANRIVNPLYNNLYRQMVPKPNQNFVESGTTPLANYYRGGEPDIPKSSLYAGRVDYNVSNNDRLFIRGSGNTFIEGVSDWTYEVPAYEGLHSIDRSRYNWGFVGNWTRTTGMTVIDTQVASNRFFQDDQLNRLHEFKPTDMGFPAYMNEFCQSQNDCMLPNVDFTGTNNYQDISNTASSADKVTNLQGTVNLTRISGSHTLRGGVDGRLAQRQRGPGGTPSGQLQFTNDFTRQASDIAQLTPSNLGLTMAAFMLGIPTASVATIQPTTNLRNHYFATFAQDTWRASENLTLNFGLRFEWEDGISEDDNAMLVDFDPNATLAISDLAQAAYARSPVAGLAPSDFRVRGGSVYASAPGQSGKTWDSEVMFMPRLSASYQLGEKTVLKAGYGLYYDTLNAADYTANITGFSSTTTNTNSTDFGQTFSLGNPYAGVLGISDPFPLRSDGTRFDAPTGDTLGVNAAAGLTAPGTDNDSYPTSNRKHARQQRWRFAIQRELAANLSVEVAYDGSYSDRIGVNIRQDYLPEQYWIPGSLNARDAAAQTLLASNVTNPYNITNFAALRTSDPVLYQRMASNSFFTSPTTQRNRLLRPFSHLNNVVFGDLPLGEAKTHSLQILANRRFTNGFTANAALSFNSSRSTRTVHEFDREPTTWWDNNNSRPYRLSAGAVYELPFGTNKPLLNEGGILAALVGGWQVAGTFERQPGSLINFTTNTAGAPNGNVFFTGDIDNIKKDNPEIALNADGTLDASKYWFNVEGFERDAARTPTAFQTRSFPLQIDGLRGPGLMYLNMNVSRTFSLGGTRTIQARADIQNLLNYAAYSNPVTDPTNTNFGKVVAAVGAAGAMRFFNFGVRFAF